MEGLLQRLRSAATEWRNEKRDFKLMKVFLESPDQRLETIESATPAARYLMPELMKFVASEHEQVEIRIECMSSNSLLGKTRIPTNIYRRWFDLLRQIEDESRTFSYMTDKGPVPVFVSEPRVPAIKAADSVDAVIDKLSMWDAFVFSKS